MFEKNIYWKQVQEFLPEHNRITDEYKPSEATIMYNTTKIRYDEYNPKNSSDTSIVIFHGVGGNGRLLSFIAVPLVKAGFNVICPDLPGYGYSSYQKDLDYAMWIDVGSFMVNNEINKGKKVFLFGLSAGGMLAYNIACNTKNIKGLIVTNILDNRYQIVRDFSAKNKFQSRVGIKLMNIIPGVLQKRLKIAVKEVANMRTIVNDRELMKILLKDKVGSGSSVSIYFLVTMMNLIPLIEPEYFTLCPVLMLHPEDDRWTPVDVSKLFFDKIKAPKKLRILENAGHFPIESPGLQQLETELLSFIKNGIQSSEKLIVI
jgi:alpha-beta hydrolase superfamily lysophospholipase